jgi:hypothetical protein
MESGMAEEIKRPRADAERNRRRAGSGAANGSEPVGDAGTEDADGQRDAGVEQEGGAGPIGADVVDVERNEGGEGGVGQDAEAEHGSGHEGGAVHDPGAGRRVVAPHLRLADRQ